MKKYVFKPYNKNFPELFSKEKKRIAYHIKQSVIIEHIGSTAIPHLGGKGIIDIGIAVDKKEMDVVAEHLLKLGYTIKPQGSTPNRIFLKADLPDDEEGIRTYHIHLTHLDSQDWKDFISFRDHLRKHPKEVQIYAELKKKAVEEVEENGAKYREAKAPLFKKILSSIKKDKKIDP